MRLKAITGIYDNGEIEPEEILENIPPKTKVIITFLETPKTNSESGPPYSDLDHLIGTWTAEDEAEFRANTQQFEEIDQSIF